MESRLELTFTGSVAEVVTPHIGWDGDGHWDVDVGAGTDMLTMGSDDLMKSSCLSEASKGHDVLKVKEYNYQHDCYWQKMFPCFFVHTLLVWHINSMVKRNYKLHKKIHSCSFHKKT